MKLLPHCRYDVLSVVNPVVLSGKFIVIPPFHINFTVMSSSFHLPFDFTVTVDIAVPLVYMLMKRTIRRRDETVDDDILLLLPPTTKRLLSDTVDDGMLLLLVDTTKCLPSGAVDDGMLLLLSPPSSCCLVSSMMT